jgi:hypothetical protein
MKDYEMALDNLRQVIEALGCENRYYFYEHHNRGATSDEELMQFYIKQGGAENYRRKKNELCRMRGQEDSETPCLSKTMARAGNQSWSVQKTPSGNRERHLES